MGGGGGGGGDMMAELMKRAQARKQGSNAPSAKPPPDVTINKQSDSIQKVNEPPPSVGRGSTVAVIGFACFKIKYILYKPLKQYII